MDNDRSSSKALGLVVLLGVVWFLGSALMGLLYDMSLPALVLFSVTVQLGAIPPFLASHRRAAHAGR